MYRFLEGMSVRDWGWICKKIYRLLKSLFVEGGVGAWGTAF